MNLFWEIPKREILTLRTTNSRGARVMKMELFHITDKITMKTKELIRQLMEEDPSGEIECCVGNVDIFYVSREPAYYDGTLQVLIRDPAKKPYYDVIGGKYVREGDKIQFHTLSIGDIMDDPEIIIDYRQVGEEALVAKYAQADEENKKAWVKLHKESEWRLFEIWIKNRGAEISGMEVDLRGAYHFFEKEIFQGTKGRPLPTEKTQDEINGKCAHDSYVNKRKLQWDIHVNISFSGMDWHYEWKE